METVLKYSLNAYYQQDPAPEKEDSLELGWDEREAPSSCVYGWASVF